MAVCKFIFRAHFDDISSLKSQELFLISNRKWGRSRVHSKNSLRLRDDDCDDDDVVDGDDDDDDDHDYDYDDDDDDEQLFIWHCK